MENFFQLLEKFVTKYPDAVSPAEARLAWAHSYTTRGIWLASVDRNQDAWNDFLRAMKYRSYDKRLWKSMVKVLLNRV